MKIGQQVYLRDDKTPWMITGTDGRYIWLVQGRLKRRVLIENVRTTPQNWKGRPIKIYPPHVMQMALANDLPPAEVAKILREEAIQKGKPE